MVIVIFNKVNISSVVASTCSACSVEEAPWVLSWFNHCTASTHSSSVDWTNAGCHIRTSPENASILNLTHTHRSVTGKLSNSARHKPCYREKATANDRNIFGCVILEIQPHFLILQHWSQSQFLEGHSSAQFNSNPNQTHLIQLIKVFRITRNFQAGLSWSWLELNSTELWPSRNCVWDHCPTDMVWVWACLVNQWKTGNYVNYF